MTTVAQTPLNSTELVADKVTHDHPKRYFKVGFRKERVRERERTRPFVIIEVSRKAMEQKTQRE